MTHLDGFARWTFRKPDHRLHFLSRLAGINDGGAPLIYSRCCRELAEALEKFRALRQWT